MNLKSLSVSLSFLVVVACSDKIEKYKIIAEEYESITLNCVSLLEIDGINYFLGNKFSGECLVFDGAIKRELKSFKEGVANGVQIGFYDNGNIDYVGQRVNNEIDGKYIKFHSNGKIAAKGQFQKGYYRGTFKFFNTEGEITERRKYDNSGILVKTKLFEND